jgi:hypothetical protein
MKRIALLSLVAIALVAVPSGLAAPRAKPAPGTPAGLAAKLKLKKLEAQRFTHLFTLRCRASIATNPSGPVVANPICTKVGARIVGALQTLDKAIRTKLGSAQSGSREEQLLQRLDTQLQKVLTRLRGALAVTTAATAGSGDA